MVGQKELIGLLARRAGVIAWTYDAKEDCLTYCLPNESVFSQVSGLKNGSATFDWSFLRDGTASGFVDVRETPWQEDGAFRVTYLRVSGDFVGFAEKLTIGNFNSVMAINENALVSRIDADLFLLRAREKGVLFAMEATGANRRGVQPKERQGKLYVDILEQAIKEEFRGRDIFGRVSDMRYIVFFRGELPIDVVERRAQHFLDEFSRRALDSSITASCTIGIAVTGGDRTAAKDLIEAASQALEEAMARGANHYRMYENDRY